MKNYILALALAGFIVLCAGSARAATAADLIDAVHSFVQTGLSNLDSSFVSLRGAPITASAGEHYQVKASFGDFFPDCHISGYQPPQVRNAEWVLSCSSPGLSADPNQLRRLVYSGVLHGLSACFVRTLNPALVNGEDFRWDCHDRDHAASVDVSTTLEKNGHLSFLLEVYEYLTPQTEPLTPSPAPSTTPTEIGLERPVPTLDMGGVTVPYVDYATLRLAVALSLSTGSRDVPRAVIVAKPGDEMPAYSVFWHYAGKSTNNGVPTISVWVCSNLSPQEQTMSLNEGTLMGLLDSGLGGPVLQKAYTAANAADGALGPNTDDPFVNRRRLVMSMAKYFR